MNFARIWLVARREYKEHVGKKSFWISLIVPPLLFTFVILLQIASFKARPEETRNLVLVDNSGKLGNEIAADLGDDTFKSGRNQFQVEMRPPEADTTALMADLNRRISQKEIFGYLLIGPELEAPGAYRLFLRNIGDAITTDKVEDALRRAVIGARLTDRQLTITRADLDSITKRVPLTTLKVDEKGKVSRGAFMLVWISTFVFLMFMFMPIIAYGVTALRSVLEEKSSRIIEVLLSSLTPFQLFSGKILGLALVGLTQVGAYVLSSLLFSAYSRSMAPAGMLKDIGAVITPTILGLFLIYFLLGFLLFLTIFTAIGSMVNNEQEATHMQQPVIMLLVIPMYAVFFFISNPDSTLARVMSMVPVVSPMIMMMRIMALMPPWWEIALSIVLITATIFGVAWAAARIFRIGVLMYGKRPTLPEIIKWVKTG